MEKNFLSSRSVIAALGLCLLAACGPAATTTTDAEQKVAATTVAASPNYTPVASTASYEIQSFKGARVQASGGAYTVARTTNGTQGLSILPHANARPLMLDFAISGAVEKVSVLRLRQWITLPAQQHYSVRLGPGGALHVMVVPTVGGSAVVTLNNATACASLPVSACPVMPVSSVTQ